jgi:hypothetical protein
LMAVKPGTSLSETTPPSDAANKRFPNA